MDVTIKMSDATRWRPTKAGLELVGERLGPVYRDLDLGGGGPAVFGRGLYYELTALADPLPAVASALPSGLTRTASGLEVSEPGAGFGSAYMEPFEGVSYALDDFLTPDHGRIEVVCGWPGAVAVAPTNAVLVGLVNPTTGEYAACGLIGSGTSGSSEGVGAVVKLGLDPPRLALGPTAARRVALLWTPADLVGVPGVGLEVVYSAPDGSGDVAELGSEALPAASRADWRAFLEHPDTQPGIYIPQDSMGPGSDSTPGLIESLLICP